MFTAFAKRVMAAVVGVFLYSAAVQAEGLWLTDYEAALKQAKAENKRVLLDFTGSDWCGWCIKLKKEVFNTPEFETYAKNNLVLVELDFPQSKPQTAAVKKQNAELAAKFGIRGYPTIIIVDGDGKPLGKLGYMPGGPRKFIEALDKVK